MVLFVFSRRRLESSFLWSLKEFVPIVLNRFYQLNLRAYFSEISTQARKNENVMVPFISSLLESYENSKH